MVKCSRFPVFHRVTLQAVFGGWRMRAGFTPATWPELLWQLAQVDQLSRQIGLDHARLPARSITVTRTHGESVRRSSESCAVVIDCP